MQFSVIGQWLIDGKSPHTGQPVLETCRIVKPGHLDCRTSKGDVMYIINADDRIIYQVGKTYAIQPGRGQKSIGRTPPIVSIRRQDVREMTQDDAIARGFSNSCHYLQVWCEMHDPKALTAWRTGFKDTCGNFFDVLRAWGKLERYDAWVLRFAANPAAPGDSAQGRGDERERSDTVYSTPRHTGRRVACAEQ